MRGRSGFGIGWVLLPLSELGKTRRGLVLGVEVKHHGFTFGHVEVETSGTYPS